VVGQSQGIATTQSPNNIIEGSIIKEKHKRKETMLIAGREDRECQVLAEWLPQLMLQTPNNLNISANLNERIG
jgi:hypothetical protein